MINKVKQKPRGIDIFGKHPFWLGRYYLLNIVIYLTASAFILSWFHLFETVSFWWILSLIPLFLTKFRYIIAGSISLIVIAAVNYWSELTSVYLILLPIAIFIGHLTAVFIHNAVHYNFKPIWLNIIVGELCALQQLSAGFPVFQFVHNEHHAHSDDPVKDPHPTKGYTFWRFIDVSRELILNRLSAIYFEHWGDSEKSRHSWKIQMTLLLCARFTKTFFLFVLLGPKIFALLYLPSYISNVFIFAAFNFYTHVTKEDGTVEILNLENNLYFRLCNKFLFGVMYHKNHHLRPGLFNPMDLKLDASRVE